MRVRENQAYVSIVWAIIDRTITNRRGDYQSPGDNETIRIYIVLKVQINQEYGYSNELNPRQQCLGKIINLRV